MKVVKMYSLPVTKEISSGDEMYSMVTTVHEVVSIQKLLRKQTLKVFITKKKIQTDNMKDAFWHILMNAILVFK